MTHDGSTLTVEAVDRVADSATVRHVDQLSPETRRALRELADGERRAVSGLEPGEIVVSVSYYRVVRAESKIEERDAEPVRA